MLLISVVLDKKKIVEKKKTLALLENHCYYPFTSSTFCQIMFKFSFGMNIFKSGLKDETSFA